MPKSPVSLTPTSCCTLLTVSHLTCPVPLDRTQIQLTRKHRVTYLGNSQHTYIGARGGGTISRSQESSNDAADTLSEYSPVNLNKMVKYLFCKTLRKKKSVPVLPVDGMYWRGCGPRQTSAGVIITDGLDDTSHDGAQHSQHPGKRDNWQTPLACQKLLTINNPTCTMHKINFTIFLPGPTVVSCC